MTVHVDLDGGQLVITAQRREAHHVKRVHAVRYRNGEFRAPADLSVASALNHVVKDLDIAPKAEEWFAKELAVKAARGLTSVQSDERLRDHQSTIVGWLQEGTTGILTAGTGTGKTRAGLSFLAGRPPGGVSLVVAPLIVVAGWLEESELWADEVQLFDATGTAAKRRKAIVAAAEHAASGGPHAVLLMSYDSIASHSALTYYSKKLTDKQKMPGELNDIAFDTIILDEGHRIRTPTNVSTRAIWTLSKQAQHRYIFTATPVANQVGDVWALLRFLQPEIHTSRSKFLDIYADVDVDWWGNMHVRGVQSGAESAFRLVLDNVGHWHVATEDVVDLPPVVFKEVSVKLRGSSATQYRTLEEKSLLEIGGSSEIITDSIVRQTRLEQIAQGGLTGDTASPDIVQRNNIKLAALGEILESIPEDEGVVVFSKSKQLATYAAEELDGVLLTGDTKDTAEVIDAFQAGRGRVLCCTLAKASEGITLTRASHVVYLQGSYSLIEAKQSAGRVLRMGQTAKTVVFWTVVTEDTIDINPALAVERKAAILGEVLGE